MTNSNLLKRTLAILAAFAMALAATGCGQEEERHEGREGQYIDIGGLKYQVQISRDLNPRDAEDRAYVGSLPELDAGKSYFGVFLRVINESGERQVPLPADQMKVVDTEGNEFHPIEADARGFEYVSEPIEPGGQIPEKNTPAYQSAISGSLVLFVVDVESTENRPLELELEGPVEGGHAAIELDI